MSHLSHTTTHPTPHQVQYKVTRIPLQHVAVLECRRCNLVTLDGLERLPLRELHADYNQLSEMGAAMDILAQLSVIEKLVLVGNPLTSSDGYTALLIEVCCVGVKCTRCVSSVCPLRVLCVPNLPHISKLLLTHISTR
jgi:hypothetical protein